MGISCSVFAIAAERYDSLRNDPLAVTDEAWLRIDLSHLASMREPDTPEAETLAEIRAQRDEYYMSGSEELHHHTDPRDARTDALVDAALASGNRELPLELYKDWEFLEGVLNNDSEGPKLGEFFFGGISLGDDVGYGPPRLHDPAAVAGFAASLGQWTSEHFAAAAQRRLAATLIAEEEQLVRAAVAERRLAALIADGFLAQDRTAPDIYEVERLTAVFLSFRNYLMNAAANRAGLLVWMT
jgi:hypothetical protein